MSFFKSIVIAVSFVFFVMFAGLLIDITQTKPQTFVQGTVTKTDRYVWMIDGKLSTGENIKANLFGDEKPDFKKVYISKTAETDDLYPGYTSKHELLFALYVATGLMIYSLAIFIVTIIWVVYADKKNTSTQDKPKIVMDSIKI